MSTVETSRRLDFSLERLEDILGRVHERVFLRHDVDYDLGAALEMARFEESLGVASTFYVRASARVYGDISLDDLLLAGREIAGRGHRLGAHVELLLPRDAIVPQETLRAACRDAVEYLEDEVGLDVAPRVSFHAPPLDALFRHVGSFENAMTPGWKDCYVSDGRGVFRFDHPEERLGTGRRLQLNLHPEWWFLDLVRKEELRAREAVAP